MPSQRRGFPGILQRRDAGGENPLAGQDRYVKIRTIGRGSYGLVLLAVDTQTKEKVAVKLWPRKAEYITVNLQRELHNHSEFKHPNIIEFRQMFLTPTHVGLAMEFAPSGDLFHKVRDAGGVSENEARGYFVQLLLALDYCHRLGVVNRDIKLENVLLGGDKRAPVLKLTDFGFCKSERDSVPDTMVGTEVYMAPEVMCGGRYCGKQADVWSAGVMLYVIIYGQYPFEDPMQATQQEVELPEKPLISSELRSLFKAMLNRCALKRLRLDGICAHPWVAQDVPAGFFDQNRHHLAATSAREPPQSRLDIDQILAVVMRELRNSPSADRTSSQGPQGPPTPDKSGEKEEPAHAHAPMYPDPEM